jgi:hypothetical protein
VVATDANGCEGLDTVTVNVDPAPTANAGPDVNIAAGGSTTIGGSPTGTGGTPPYTYSWSPTTGLDNPSAANPIASPASTTTYTVTVTDANGCQGTDAVTVTVGPGGEVATTLDIIPGECPNELEVDSDESLRVAIVGTESFDVDDIDRDSILLEGVSPFSIRSKDVSTPFEGGLCECPPDDDDDDDEDSDDIDDLRLKFETSEIVEAAGLEDLDDGDEVVLTLTAMANGTPLQLSDCVIVRIEDDDDEDTDEDTDGDDDNDEDTDDGGDDDDNDEDTEAAGEGGGSSDGLALGRGQNATDYGLGDADFRLYSAGPNPFSSRTTIRFAIRNESPVRLTVYDVAGREVETLVDGARSAGEHTVTWDAHGLPSGVYFYRITVAGFAETKKVIVAR